MTCAMAAHFAECIRAIRQQSPKTRIEVPTSDLRGPATTALDILAANPPDVMNHNIETVPRQYKRAHPGADYGHSLPLLLSFKERCSDVQTKSGLMLGLGEIDSEVLDVLWDMRLHGIDMLTVGQYLQLGNLPIERYVEPAQFDVLAQKARALGFSNVACGPFVRSSYHADLQAHLAGITTTSQAAATTRP